MTKLFLATLKQYLSRKKGKLIFSFQFENNLHIEHKHLFLHKFTGVPKVNKFLDLPVFRLFQMFFDYKEINEVLNNTDKYIELKMTKKNLIASSFLLAKKHTNCD